jgi:hypothetical protein
MSLTFSTSVGRLLAALALSVSILVPSLLLSAGKTNGGPLPTLAAASKHSVEAAQPLAGLRLPTIRPAHTAAGAPAASGASLFAAPNEPASRLAPVRHSRLSAPNPIPPSPYVPRLAPPAVTPPPAPSAANSKHGHGHENGNGKGSGHGANVGAAASQANSSTRGAGRSHKKDSPGHGATGSHSHGNGNGSGHGKGDQDHGSTSGPNAAASPTPPGHAEHGPKGK